MKNNRKKSDAELAKGQVWKTGDAYLQIMDRGKRLIEYKMMKERGKPLRRVFDEANEDVKPSVAAFTVPGVYTVCVSATDSAGNTGEEFILLAV